MTGGHERALMVHVHKLQYFTYFSVFSLMQGDTPETHGRHQVVVMAQEMLFNSSSRALEVGSHFGELEPAGRHAYPEHPKSACSATYLVNMVTGCLCDIGPDVQQIKRMQFNYQI